MNMTDFLPLAAGFVAGIASFGAGLWLGWSARDRIGAVSGEPSVPTVTKHRSTGWEELAVGAYTAGDEEVL